MRWCVGAAVKQATAGEIVPDKYAARKRAVARRSKAPGAGTLSTLKRVERGTPGLPLWVDLHMQIGKVPALVDTGAQFSCIREDLAEFANSMGEPCRFESCSVICSLSEDRDCRVTDAVKLHIKLLSFSWDQEFRVLKGGPFP